MAEKAGGENFKSFGDLLRSRGGGDGKQEAPKAAEDRGWTLETGEGAVPEGRLAELTDLAPGARERVDARPPGFGPMPHGPAAYRDTDSEEMELLHSFRIRTVFPADVAAEMGAVPADPSEADFEGRVDLRDHTIFTVDGEDARDYDDAIEIRALEDGGNEVGVHIADVAHYVRPETALDAEALARATSVYLPDQVVPMLPEELSNGLCSLVPDRPRLAYSVYITFDERGKRKSSRVHKSVILSKKRNTYKAVQELLDGADTPEAREIAHLEEPLKRFERWARQQQKLRESAGAMRIQSTERKVQFDAEGKVAAIVDAPRYFSMSLIEETALAANQAVGDLFRERGLPTIYRVHPEKDPDEIAAVAKLLGEHGLRVPDKDRLTGRDIAQLIRTARRRPNAEALIQRIMGLVERAIYAVHDHEDVATHFGLAKEAYLHFTSPIRRYPDLIVHRWLWAIESRGDEAAAELRADALVQDLNDVAAHASVRSEMADMASRSVMDLKICQYMEPHIGEKLVAKVHRVNRGGIEVHLTDYNVNAFLPLKEIGERGQVEGPTLTVRRGKTHLSFSEGHPIAVKLKDVDFLRLQIMLELP